MNRQEEFEKVWTDSNGTVPTKDEPDLFRFFAYAWAWFIAGYRASKGEDPLMPTPELKEERE